MPLRAAFITPSLPFSLIKPQHRPPLCKTPSPTPPKRPRPILSAITTQVKRDLTSLATLVQSLLTPQPPRSAAAKSIAEFYVSTRGAAERAAQRVAIQVVNVTRQIQTVKGWRLLSAFEWQLPGAEYRREMWRNRVQRVLSGNGWGGVVGIIAGVATVLEGAFVGAVGVVARLGKAEAAVLKGAIGSENKLDIGEDGELVAVAQQRKRVYRHSGEAPALKDRELKAKGKMPKRVYLHSGQPGGPQGPEDAIAMMKKGAAQSVLERPVEKPTFVDSSFVQKVKEAQKQTGERDRMDVARGVTALMCASGAIVVAGTSLPAVATVSALAATGYVMAKGGVVKDTAVHVRARGMLRKSSAVRGLEQWVGERGNVSVKKREKVGQGETSVEVKAEQVGENAPAVMAVPVLGWFLAGMDRVAWMMEGMIGRRGVYIEGWRLLGGLQRGFQGEL